MFSWRSKDEGLYLGRFVDKGRVRSEVRYRDNIHVVTIGPTGSGKGTGLIIPNLSGLKRSIFIIDPKGEAAAVTARARARLGRVIPINPFNVLADTLPHLQSQGFNALTLLDPRSDNFPDDASGIAEALVRVEGSEPHWSASAQDLVSALVMWECMMKGHAASLGNVRKMLTEPFVKENDQPIGLFRTVLEMLESGYEPLVAKAGRFVRATNEMLGVISTAMTQTRFVDSPPIKRDMSGAGFDFADMKREIITVYLILPADRLETHANYLRLVVTSALRALLRSPPSSTLPPVLVMLDEFAQLGYLPPIENAMGIAKGFGVQLWPFLQDLNQLHALYKDRWQTFIGNAGVVTAFAPRDLFTAKYLSDMCGQKTVNVKSRSQTDQGQSSWNESPHGFPLFRPEDLMKMPPGMMLCLAAGVDPFFAMANGYWETSYGRDLDPNPYFRPRR
jgi:type IV secretion system protein VirD4